VVVQFILLQMDLHHPREARCEEEGAYASDWDEWRRCLRRIYSNLVETVAHNLGRVAAGKGSSASKMSGGQLGQDHLRLAARVCFQLIAREDERGDSEDLTQYVQRDVTQQVSQQQQQPGKKRRRIERVTLKTLLAPLDRVHRSSDPGSSSVASANLLGIIPRRSLPSVEPEALPWLQIVNALLKVEPDFFARDSDGILMWKEVSDIY